MKRVFLIVVTAAVAAATATSAPAKHSLTLVLAGGAEESGISIALSADGRSYVIDSLAPLEVGGDVCAHPEGEPNRLVCSAAQIGGFEANVGAGDDSVMVAREVPVPVTLRGGPGLDRLVGGGAGDKLIGGPHDDVLIGRAGEDSIFGGPGDDRLVGCAGDDVLHGDSGTDALLGGSGRNALLQ